MIVQDESCISTIRSSVAGLGLVDVPSAETM
jgi:hypothetical protein